MDVKIVRESAVNGVLRRTLECELEMLRYFAVLSQERVPGLWALHADPDLVSEHREVDDNN